MLWALHYNLKKNPPTPALPLVGISPRRAEGQESFTLRVAVSGKGFSPKTQNVPLCFCTALSVPHDMPCRPASP